ncbi:hypothetical protein Ocin01_19022 [Orchesella cincta]|uniref:Uncharacterized protein n=1 Tax=Orchesella cincta TaxID=48709 RepID=A0A1D2M3W6_ORCCI|nr:hypothetical protein Ocin01_19022 [Orchesella cincta]
MERGQQDVTSQSTFPTEIVQLWDAQEISHRTRSMEKVQLQQRYSQQHPQPRSKDERFGSPEFLHHHHPLKIEIKSIQTTIANSLDSSYAHVDEETGRSDDDFQYSLMEKSTRKRSQPPP